MYYSQETRAGSIEGIQGNAKSLHVKLVKMRAGLKVTGRQHEGPSARLSVQHKWWRGSVAPGGTEK